MIVFDLICQEASHQFEGWFGSSDDYVQQQIDGLLVCPICGSANISKAMMAPNVGAKSNQSSSTPFSRANPENVESNHPETESTSNGAVQVPSEYRELLSKLAKAQSKALENSEWVGDSLPERAREMHYGDSEEKPIHGTASSEEIAELEDEGIDLTALPFPVTPPESQN